MISECDGIICTDYREGWYREIDIYREEGMPSHCVRVKGDKGQIAKLIQKPVLLFDDKERNIDMLTKRSTDGCLLDGVIVRRGRNKWRHVEDGYLVQNDCNRWCEIIERFTDDPTRLPSNGWISKASSTMRPVVAFF